MRKNQWDIIGESNANISSSYNGWIDLFAWGTSGYKYRPDSIYYMAANNSPNHLAISSDIEYTRYDWGYYNKISNADHNFEWRTLNQEEWNYLLSHHDWYMATINNIKGLILLPESYEEPMYISYENHNADHSKYKYNLKTWKLIEEQGAVFLPAAGKMAGYFSNFGYSAAGSDMNRVYYWSSTLYEYKTSTIDSSYANLMKDGEIIFRPQEQYFSVRLVRDVEE